MIKCKPLYLRTVTVAFLNQFIQTACIYENIFPNIYGIFSVSLSLQYKHSLANYLRTKKTQVLLKQFI